ncbi:MAG: hypothetical protein ACRDLV_07045 [Solirubrobacteraceae bacterium]
MAATPSVILVVAPGDERAGEADLESLIGVGRSGAVARELEARARAWADGVAPGRVQATSPARVEAAAGAALDSGDPLLVVWPRLPRWLPAHAEGALDDLVAGCDVSIGPVFAGGLYLLAIARRRPELLALIRPPDLGPDAFGTALDAVQSSGLAVGLLRAERGLRTAADVRAALADPLLDDELRALLS